MQANPLCRISIVLLTASLLLYACGEEEINKPVFRTLEVTELSDLGVTINGGISFAGNAPFESYGFVWAAHTEPTLSDSVLYISQQVPKQGTFNARLSNDLVPGARYYVRCFLKSKKELLFANTVQFISRGSALPVIMDFTPESGKAQDVVTINGNNFSDVIGNNSVKIGALSCTIISNARNKLTIQLPAEYVAGHYPISVSVFGKTVTSKTEFTLEGPVIENLSPTSGPPSTILEINGNHFSTTAENNIVMIGSVTATVQEASANFLRVLVPHDNLAGFKEVTVQVKGARYIASQKFKLTGPEITSFTPTTGIQGSEVIINGTGFSSTPEWNNVMMGGTYASIISATPTQLVIKVPDIWYPYDTPYNGETNISVQFDGLGFVSENVFTIKGPRINSFTPDAQYGGRTITIYGENFDYPNKDPYVTFGGIMGSIITNTPSSIVVKVPEVLNYFNSGPISVQVGGIVCKSENEFKLLNPWQKLSAFPGNKRFGAIGFSIGSYGYVGMGLDPIGDFNDLWRFDPSNNSWKQMADFPGSSRADCFSFTINGKAYIGGGGHYRGSYDVNNYLYDFWEYDPSGDSWTQKSSLPVSGAILKVGATAIGPYGYFVAGNILYKYDPSTDLWTKSNTPIFFEHSPHAAGTIYNKGYFGFGYANSTLWEFDPASSTWTEVFYPANFSYWNVTNFTVSNKFYTGYEYGTYQFDPATNTWTAAPNLPSLGLPASFTIDDIEYLATGIFDGQASNLFYSFNSNY